MAKQSSSRRFVVRAAALFIGVGVIVFLASPSLLTVVRPCTHADAIVVLGGGEIERPERAAQLYRQGIAPLIILTGEGDWPRNRAALLRFGVPEKDIVVEPAATTTHENALLTAPILRQRRLHNAVLVTTWYHSRRALNCFRRAVPDVTFCSEPSLRGIHIADWWREGMVRFVASEYPKTLFYWLRWGVSPWDKGPNGAKAPKPGVTNPPVRVSHVLPRRHGGAAPAVALTA